MSFMCVYMYSTFIFHKKQKTQIIWYLDTSTRLIIILKNSRKKVYEVV